MKLTAEQLAHFDEFGYVIVEGVFSPEEDIDPVIEEYKGVLDSLAHELFEAGEISSLYEDLPFSDRLIAVYQESGKVHAQYFDFSLPQGNVKPDTPFWAGPAVFHMLTNDSLLDSVESILGGRFTPTPSSMSPQAPGTPHTGQRETGACNWARHPSTRPRALFAPKRTKLRC